MQFGAGMANGRAEQRRDDGQDFYNGNSTGIAHGGGGGGAAQPA